MATILTGAGIGVLGSTINPFATDHAANAAASLPKCMILRVVILLGGLRFSGLMSCAMRIGSRPIRPPDRGGQADAHRRLFLHAGSAIWKMPPDRHTEGRPDHLCADLAAMIQAPQPGWWMDKMGALVLRIGHRQWSGLDGWRKS
ncbi:MAG: hypothetical protein H6895_01300 [Defluviimonas sp.]|nr:hypothetical protein [Defluviimonas sp.]